MLSVVIPSRREGARLLACLSALTSMDAIDEVVVAAREERPGVRRRASGCPRVHWVPCPVSSRGAQLALGAAAARGDALLFLHADTRLPDGAGRAIGRALADPAIVGGGFRLSFDAAHPALTLLARLSALPWRVAYFGDQGLFCRRKDFEAVGGFPDQPLFEDVDLAMRLARRGRLVRLAGRAMTSGRRFLDAGPWRQLTLNATLLALHRLGAPAERLAAVYRP